MIIGTRHGRWHSAAFVLAMAMAPSGFAAPVLGNLGQLAVDHEVPVTLYQWQASSFRIAEGAGSWRVRSISVRLAKQVENASFSFRITGESSLRPALGDIRAAFTTPALTNAGTQNLTFLVKNSPAPLLLPGQTYWLVAGIESQDGNFTPSTGLYFWSYATGQAADPTPALGWSFGLTTASAGTLGSNWTPETTTPFSFSIDAVPETTSMSLTRWRELNPGGPADDTIFLTGDHDQDGLSGLLEFAWDSNRANMPAPITTVPGRRGIEYVRWTSAPELSLRLEISSNLMSWTTPSANDLDTTTSEAGPFSTRVRTLLRQSSGNVFLRVRVTKL